MATVPPADKIEQLKFNLRESQSPYFSDDELNTLLNNNSSTDSTGVTTYDVDQASYMGLIMKAEDDSIKLSGLDIPSSQKYFLRLSRQFRKSQTQTIKRADEPC